MKKVLILAALTALLAFAGTSKTFAQAYQNGSNHLNVGLGIGTYYSGGLGIGASFEHGFTDAISGGAILGYSSANDNFGVYDYGFRVLTIGVRASYHFTELLKINNDKLDLYGGAGLAYRNLSYKNDLIAGYNARGSSVFPVIHAGVRYFFAENIGVYGEVGYSFATLQGGVTFKF